MVKTRFQYASLLLSVVISFAGISVTPSSAWAETPCSPETNSNDPLITQVQALVNIASPESLPPRKAYRKTYMENSDHFLHPGSPGLGNKESTHIVDGVGFPNFSTNNPTYLAFSACRGEETSAQYFQCTKKACSGMNLQDRLLYNSYVGDLVSLNYDKNELHTNKSATIEQVYQQLHHLTKSDGGICREEHTFIGLSAQACGFEDAGLPTLAWQKSPLHGNVSSWHTTGIYRDKASGTYFLQNYYSIFKLDAGNFSEARNISQQFLSPFTTAMTSESIGNKMHLISTPFGEWTHNQVTALFDLQKKNGLAITGGTAEQSVAYRNGNLGFIATTSNGYKYATAQFLVESQIHHGFKSGGSIDINSRAAVGPSFMIAPPAQYFDETEPLQISANPVSPNRTTMGVLTETHLVFHPTEKSKAQLEGDAVMDSMSFRSMGNGGNHDGQFAEVRAGVSYHTSNLDHQGTDLYLGEVANPVFKSNLDISHVILDQRTELDVVHWLSPNAKLCARMVGYGTATNPDALGYSLCGEIQGGAAFAGVQTSRIISNRSHDPFYDQSKEIHEFYAGLRKTWENSNTGKYKIEINIRSSNGQGLRSIDLDTSAVPGGRRAGPSIDLNLTNKR